MIDYECHWSAFRVDPDFSLGSDDNMFLYTIFQCTQNQLAMDEYPGIGRDADKMRVRKICAQNIRLEEIQPHGICFPGYC